ncbi:hypothetical protein KUCAC02_032879 [Chaenocephalus aceratus]|nr:hypothetical protein KUCAC02_032879 [Chaenocephalus aceratus]
MASSTISKSSLASSFMQSLVFSHLRHRMNDQQQECSNVMYSPADGVRMSFRGKRSLVSVRDDDFVQIAELEWSHQKVTSTLQEGVPIFSLPRTFDQEGDLFRMRGGSLIGSLNRDYSLEAGLQENVQELTLICILTVNVCGVKCLS